MNDYSEIVDFKGIRAETWFSFLLNLHEIFYWQEPFFPYALCQHHPVAANVKENSHSTSLTREGARDASPEPSQALKSYSSNTSGFFRVPLMK